VSPTDAPEFLPFLLQKLAERHRVLVSAPERSPLSPVFGGPVYRVNSGKIRHFADAVEALFELYPGNLAVLILAENPDARSLKAWSESLPEGVGACVLLLEPIRNSAFLMVNCKKTENGWVFGEG
jgi:hypothetical protein